MAFANMGVTSMSLNNLDEAKKKFEEALKLSREFKLEFCEIVILQRYVRLATRMGKMNE